MPPVFGRNAYIGLGAEVTPGTAVALTHYLRVSSASIQQKSTRSGVPVLYQAGGVTHRYELETQRAVAGDTEIPVSFTGFGVIFKAALGSSATTGSGPSYVHTYTPAAALTSYTVSLQKGTGGSETFAGMYANTIEIATEAGSGALTCSIGWMGMTGGGDDSALSFGSSTATKWVAAHHAATLSFNGQTYALQSATFKLDNKLEEIRTLGSKTATAIARSDFAEATMEIVVYDDSAGSLYDAHLSGDVSDASIEFTNGTESITFHFESATIQDFDMTFDGVDKRAKKVTFKGFSDGTNEAFKITVGNTQSSATAV